MLNFTRGGQIILHRIQMFRQVLYKSMIYSILLSLCITVIIARYQFPTLKKQSIPLYARATFGDYTHQAACWIKKNVLMGKYCYPATMKMHNGQEINIKYVLEDRDIRQDIGSLKAFGYQTIKILIGFLVSLFVGLIVFLSKIGKLNKDLEDNIVKTAAQVNKHLKKRGILGAIKIGEMHLPKDSETRHTLVLGSTGSGKTNLIHNFSSEIRRLKQPAIILDQTGEMIKKHYDKDKGDMIFIPSGQDLTWDLKTELDTAGRLYRFAVALISARKQGKTDPFWPDSAIQLFQDSFKHVIIDQGLSIKDLNSFFNQATLEELRNGLEDTKSRRFVEPGNESTTLSILKHLASCLSWFEHIESGNKQSFSIKSFCQDIEQNPTKDRWLFVTVPQDATTLFGDFNNTILSLFISSVKELGPNLARRIWLIIDELASFGNLTELKTGVAELRKYGGCILTATQNIEQLDENYGVKVTRSLLGNFNTKFFFKGHVNQDVLNSAFGEIEIDKNQESISYGAHEMRDGVSISQTKIIRPFVRSADLSTLSPLECYVALDDTEVKCAKIKVPFI